LGAEDRPADRSALWGGEAIEGLEDERGDHASDEPHPHSGSLLGRVVDVFVGARRLAGWSLWLQLAAVAHLISVQARV
jgi:hypothetical protein